MKNKLTNLNKGFTLVELLIALSIVVALAAIALATYRSQTAKALDAKRKEDLARIQIAIEEYEKDHSCYPAPDLLSCDPGTGLQPYIDKIPCDPVTGQSYYYDYDNSPACSTWYRIFTTITDATASQIGPGGSYNYYVASPNALSPEYVLSGGVFGCRGGFCVAIGRSGKTGKAECILSFDSPDCNGQCGISSTECKTW